MSYALVLAHPPIPAIRWRRAHIALSSPGADPVGAVRPPAPAATDGDERPRRHHSDKPPALPPPPLAATVAYRSRRSLAPAPCGTVCLEGTRPRAFARPWGLRRPPRGHAGGKIGNAADVRITPVAEGTHGPAAGSGDARITARRLPQRERTPGRIADSATKGAREEDRSPQAARDCASCTVRPACTDGRRGRARARGLMPARRMAGHAIGTRLLSLAG